MSDSITIMDLPSFIFTDILSKLPIQTIFSCRCVCKTWLNLLSDPHFTKLHFSRAPVGLMLRTNGRECVSNTLFLVDLNGDTSRHSNDKGNGNGNDKGNGNGEMKLDTKFNLPRRHAKPNIKPEKSKKFKFTKREFDVVNSCNGLLCLCKPSSTDPSIVCNPITGEYITIPKPEKVNIHECTVTSGFGFSPRTNEYKVVRMEYRLSEQNLQTISNAAVVGQSGHMRLPPRAAEVYTLGTASWRCIGYAPYTPRRSVLTTFLNGAIHWPCDNIYTSHFIVAFDFDNEEFRVVPPPPHFGMKQKRDVYKRTVGELRGSLCLSDVSSYNHFEFSTYG